MTNFKSKNLCDKNSKNKNLRWQFCWIFRWLRRGILSFFCRWFFHGEICKISLLIFRIFMKIEKNKFLSAKICTLKFVFVIIFIMRTVRNLLSDRCKKRFRKQTFLGLTPVTWANTIWGKSPAFYLEVYVLVLFNHMVMEGGEGFVDLGGWRINLFAYEMIIFTKELLHMLVSVRFNFMCSMLPPYEMWLCPVQ